MFRLTNRSARAANRSIRTAVGIGLAAAVALVGLAGCARLRDRAVDDAELSDLSWDAQALQTLGYDSVDISVTGAAADTVTDGSDSAASATTDDGAPGRRGRHPRLRYVFQHALHGEATLQTDEGLKTVVAQRGTLTQVTDTTITVSSSDGYTVTWTLGGSSVVVVDRARSTIDAVAVGTEVGVAGSREGDTVTLRLLVVPRA
jgi:hypothetical protein